jgi:hypothetical protein
MREEIRIMVPEAEFYTDEGCHINELSNSQADPEVSIAQARGRPGCRQRISCLGKEDLVFLAICTPRFQPEVYLDIDPSPMPSNPAT